MLRTAAAIALLCVVCAQSETVEPPAVAAAKRLPLDLCNLEGVDEPVLCGTFFAPEDRNEPDGRTTPVSIIVIPAENGNPDNIGWIEHHGGPGRLMHPVAPYFTKGKSLERFRVDRDVVLFEQRGVGASGGLYCGALRELPILAPYYTEAKVKACREEMVRNGAKLENYSTLAAVDDLEAIRKWLGYEQFDAAGWSYGSRFMLTYANRYPHSVRTLMVALPTIFDYRRPLDWALFSEAALRGLFEDCRSDEACNETFPALADDFHKVLARLDALPASVTFFNPISEQEETAQIDRARFLEEVHVGLLRVDSLTALPLVIHEAAKGNFEPFKLLAVPETAPRPIAEAQYLSIVCPEETAFFSFEDARDRSKGTLTGALFTDEYKMACSAWGLPAHPDYPLEWTAPESPTLVISGDRDPITPAHYGEKIAASLPNSLHIVVHRMPHDFSSLEGASCLEDIMLDFVARGDVRDLDTSCVKNIKPLPFILAMPQ